MDSNPRFQQQQQQPNSGLLRFRSAPSSVLHSGAASASYKANPPNESSSSISSSSPLTHMNSQHGYITGVPSRFMRQNSITSSAMDSSYDLVGSMGMEHQQTNNKSFGSDILRQNSFPVGNFSNNNISFQNGYDTMKGIGNYGVMDGSDSELSLSMNRLKNQISFSPRSPSLGMLSQGSKLENEGIGATSSDDGREEGHNDDARYYEPGFPYDSWNGTSQLSEKLSGFKRERDSNDKLFFDAQNGELENQVHTLSHHLSLPKTSSEMFGMENLLQFPDSVPCKIRAKRGCATHPRSIAERVRRTRISERMRKLQELVPNMDKQTSTADMLDFAVDYIKDLQKQFKSLSDKRAKCKCISMQKPDTNQS
ncbi:hypothetical protein TanjilG_06882 [Lupinus angustifolius]|uniref:BHLH domain-containing protein n=1 Tax=Lupinus angustifolius TaxID=3871 RepID=A0A4P1QV15_LUPAN|nr:PREDICTED: transcription factor bHLH130-like [Lupinus angustifolius]OIV95420.1 hypothetical protein TanjilG_06882 [Lupinus angustifolius]